MKLKNLISYSCKSISLINVLLTILTGYIFFVLAVGTAMSQNPYDPPFQISTGCGNNQAEAMKLKEGMDFPQDAAWQDVRWELMKATFPGLQDSDRLANATLTYNCHSYIFNNSRYWINDPSPYKGTGSGCYEENSNGTIRSDGTRHSCTVDYVGKCGNEFLTKRNDLVYGSVNPIYKKVITPIPIPALSEWKQIFLVLLFLATGILFIRRRQTSIAINTGGSLHLNNIEKSFIFEHIIFSKVMVCVLTIVASGFGVIIWLFGGISVLDFVGTLFCVPLVGYILQTVILCTRSQTVA